MFAGFKGMGLVMVAIGFLLAGNAFAQGKTVQKTDPKAIQKTVEKGEKGEAGEEGEGQLKMKDLPKAVQATVIKETQGAEIVGIGKETDAGKTVYEIETKVKGRTRDMLIDDKGVLTEVEEETDVKSLPAVVQAEVIKSIGKAKLVKLETVLNGLKVKTGLVALVDTAGTQSEVEMGLDGKIPVKK
jgi:hypothetical protein